MVGKAKSGRLRQEEGIGCQPKTSVIYMGGFVCAYWSFFGRGSGWREGEALMILYTHGIGGRMGVNCIGWTGSRYFLSVYTSWERKYYFCWGTKIIPSNVPNLSLRSFEL